MKKTRKARSKPMTFVGIMTELFQPTQVISKGNKSYVMCRAIIEDITATGRSVAQVCVQFSDKFDYTALQEMKGLPVKVYLSPRIVKSKTIFNNLNCYMIMPVELSKYRLHQSIFDNTDPFTRNVDEDGYDARYNS